MDSSGQLTSSDMPEIDKAREAALYKKYWQINQKYHDANIMLRLGVTLGGVVILVLLLVIYTLISNGRPEDSYYIVNEKGVVGQLQGLDRPNEGKDALSDWVSSAVSEIMTFGFNDIDERFDISKELFTPQGWDEFSQAMVKSGFVDNVMDNKLMVTAAPSSEPLLVQDGIIDGSFKWVYQVGVLVTYRSGGEKRNENKMAVVYVEKIPTSENPMGIGISQFMLY